MEGWSSTVKYFTSQKSFWSHRCSHSISYGMRCEFLESTPSYSDVIDFSLYFNRVLTAVVKQLHFQTLIPSRPHTCNQRRRSRLRKTCFHFTAIHINILVFPLPKHTEQRAFRAMILMAAAYVCCVGTLGALHRAAKLSTAELYSHPPWLLFWQPWIPYISVVTWHKPEFSSIPFGGQIMF